MTGYPPAEKVIFSICVLLSLVLASCSDSEPKIAAVDGFVVFDFESENTRPSVKLSVFAETSSDAHRVERITVSSVQNSYEWTSMAPVIISDDRKQWAGYSGFICPGDAVIPTGFYKLTYTDGEERAVECRFSISYPEKLMEAKSADVGAILDGNYTEQVAVFDESDVMLYYGLKKDSWTDSRKIFSSNKDSAYYRICLSVKNSSAVCILPPVYKKSEEKNKR